MTAKRTRAGPKGRKAKISTGDEKHATEQIPVINSLQPKLSNSVKSQTQRHTGMATAKARRHRSEGDTSSQLPLSPLTVQRASK